MRADGLPRIQPLIVVPRLKGKPKILFIGRHQFSGSIARVTTKGLQFITYGTPEVFHLNRFIFSQLRGTFVGVFSATRERLIAGDLIFSSPFFGMPCSLARPCPFQCSFE